MENKKAENQPHALSDEALDQAAGGGYFTDPYEKRCNRCMRRLETDEEKRIGLCHYCRDDTIVPYRP